MSNKLIILSILAFTAFFSSFAHSFEKTDIENKLKTIKKNISKENQKKNNLVKDLNRINANIKRTDIRINKLEKKIINISKDKKVLNSEILEIENKIKQIQQRKNESHKIIKKIIYQNYSKNSNNFFYKILNSNSKDIFLDIAFAKFINKSHKNKIDLYQIDENIKIAKLSEYNKKIKKMDNLNKDLGNKLSMLSELEEKNQLLSKKIKKRIKNSEEDYFKYLKQKSNLMMLFNKKSDMSKNVGIFKLKGQLPWPVVGEVSHNFNKFKFKNLYKWDGEIIQTLENDNVRSIFSGKVVFSDWIKGYGLIIIIDHGQNLMSLYAHNKVLLKNKGDIAKKGEIISKSGVSGGNTKNSIYFEIRKNGIPQNPHEWCNIQNKFNLAQ
tara:strand:+ start:2583 stop:3728 length:1146 start_codon:yes stop_codon:yes gene_type:complete